MSLLARLANIKYERQAGNLPMFCITALKTVLTQHATCWNYVAVELLAHLHIINTEDGQFACICVCISELSYMQPRKQRGCP